MDIVYAVPEVLDGGELERRESLLKKWASPASNIGIIPEGAGWPGGMEGKDSAGKKFKNLYPGWRGRGMMV